MFLLYFQEFYCLGYSYSAQNKLPHSQFLCSCARNTPKVKIMFISKQTSSFYSFILPVVLLVKWKIWKVKVAQLCPTLCDPMDYGVHGILQAIILEWIAFFFSRRSPQPRDWTQVFHIAGGFFTSWVPRETQEYWSGYQSFLQQIFPPRNQTRVSCIGGGFFTNWAIREACYWWLFLNCYRTWHSNRHKIHC